jgi:hypothetical protein
MVNHETTIFRESQGVVSSLEEDEALASWLVSDFNEWVGAKLKGRHTNDSETQDLCALSVEYDYSILCKLI